MKNVMMFIANELRTVGLSIATSYRNAPPGLRRGATRVLGGALVIVLGMVAWTRGQDYFERQRRETELALGPRVKTAKVAVSPAERTVKLLGEARPFAQITLFAKVSGYLKNVLVDKGDVVKKGQVLAVIESPETDAAYEAARADARNKSAIAERVAKLLQRDLVSQQEADSARAEAEVAEARLQSTGTMKSYETIRAPFAGTVTARFADPGALVQNAMNSQTSALPIVAMSQVKELRVYAYLDQRDAGAVAKGTDATITLTERPDVKLTGHVARISGQLDEKTRMLLTEIDLANADGRIVAGSLVEVAMDLKSTPGLTVPAEALVLREGLPTVPVIDDRGEVTYAAVKVIDNDGRSVKVQSGLSEGQTVALNLGNTVADHGKVRPLEAAPDAGRKTSSKE